MTTSGGDPPDPSAFAAGVDAAQRFIDAAVRRYPVDERKLVVIGFSHGGVIAYALALRDPARVAGLAALRSWLPEPLEQPLGAAAYDRLYALVHHGTQDDAGVGSAEPLPARSP